MHLLRIKQTATGPFFDLCHVLAGPVEEHVVVNRWPGPDYFAMNDAVEVFGHFARAPVAIGWILFQGFQTDPLQAIRYLGLDYRGQRRVFLQMRLDDLVDALPIKWLQ